MNYGSREPIFDFLLFTFELYHSRHNQITPSCSGYNILDETVYPFFLNESIN